MKWNRADRRRLAFASTLTVLALPAVWLANRESGSNQPNVAAVGLPAEEAAAPSTATVEAPAVPAYLDPAGTAAESVEPDNIEVAIGLSEEVLATVEATFRGEVGWSGSCWTNDVSGGQRVTIYNPANGRSVRCEISNRATLADGVVVLTPSAYAQIADLTRAPAHVEIRR